METRSDLTPSEAVAAMAELQRDLHYLARALTACLDEIGTPKNRRTYLAEAIDRAREYLDATRAITSELEHQCPPIGPDGRMRHTVADAIDASMIGRAHIGRANAIAMELSNYLDRSRAARVVDALRPFWNLPATFYGRAAGWGEQ